MNSTFTFSTLVLPHHDREGLWQMHKLYYLHVGTGKQAKRDPQELVQQVDESM
jgi:hypothetical protein